MNNILSKNQAYELDKKAINSYNIPARTLMGKAGKCIASYIDNNPRLTSIKTVAIVAGKGNNGGDGFAAGYYLSNLGYEITIFSLYEKNDLSKDSLFYYKKCIDQKTNVVTNHEPPSKESIYDLIIDSMLGIGFTGVINKYLLPWVRWINQNPLILSCDIATGINSDNGMIAGDAVRADYTLTMGYPKIGMCLEPGKTYSGLVTSADIGFPNIINKLNGIKWKSLNANLISDIIKPLNRDTHKYNQGKVLILAGSKGMTGAAYLSTIATLRAGAGLTKTCAPASINDIYEKKITEGMTISCEDNGLGYFSKSNYDQIVDQSDWADTILIGPGLGSNQDTVDLLTLLYRNIEKPMVIDADGFRPFYNDKSLFDCMRSNCIFTPHIGEFSNLIGVESEKLKEDLIMNINSFSSMNSAVLITKYSPTLVSNNSIGYINTTGNPGLSTAGSGDVLSGIISAFLAQGYNSLEASAISVFIHGYAADRVSKKISERGMIASDLLDEIAIILSEYDK